MRYVTLKKSKVVSALALSVIASSCSLRSNGQQQTVTIALPGANISQFQWLEKMTDWMSLAWASTTTTSNLDSDPTALSDFDCFAVNVSGPGIPTDPNVSCTDPTDAPAILGGFVPNGSTSMDLLVPAGPDRSIQIVGVRSLIGCPSLHDMLHDGAINFKDNIGHFYSIGGVHSDIFADASVNIKVTYNSSYPVRAFNQCKRTGEANTSHVWNVFAGTGPGYVNTTKTVNGTSYIGGKFDYVGPTLATGTILSQSNGSVASTSNNPAHINGTAYCSVPDGNGGFFVGGNFNRVDTYPYTTYPAGLIHINADGSFDSGFVVQMNSGAFVSSCAFDRNTQTVFVGGSFTYLTAPGGSTSASTLAAIPLSSKNPQNLSALFSGGSPTVSAMDVNPQTDTLYVGGNFTTLHGNTNAAAFATSSPYGEIATWSPQPNSGVGAVFADVANNTVYLGGSFTNTGHAYLMHVASTGSMDSPWMPSPSLSAPVHSIAKYGSKLYIAINATFPEIYRVDISTAAVSYSLLEGGGSDIFKSIAMSADGSQLFVGGGFLLANVHRNLISISNPASVSDASPGLGVNTSFLSSTSNGGAVYTITPNALGNMFVGGEVIASVGGFLRNNVAAIDLPTGQATSWHSPYTGLGEVKAIESDGNAVYVGYDRVTSISAPGVIKVGTDGTAGEQWITTSNSVDDIFALNLNNGYLYVGGTFSAFTNGDTGFTNVARINVGSGSPILDSTWKPSIGTTSDFVDQIIANGDTTYIKGSFTAANIGSANHLVAVESGSSSTGMSNASGWSNPTFISVGVALNSMALIPANTYSFAPSGALIIGTGTSIQLVPLTGGSTAVPWTAPAISTYMNKTTQFVLDGNTLYIAGQGNGTTPAQALLTYDLGLQVLNGFSAGIQGSTTVSSVEVVGPGALLIGGNFQQVNTVSGTGGKMAWGLGLFDANSGNLY